MNAIHATPEQTSIILRGHKRKKHMKNKYKNITNSSPGITLYPSRQFKKNTQDTFFLFNNPPPNKDYGCCKTARKINN